MLVDEEYMEQVIAEMWKKTDRMRKIRPQMINASKIHELIIYSAKILLSRPIERMIGI